MRGEKLQQLREKPDEDALEEELDRLLDDPELMNARERFSLGFPDGRYHIYDEPLKTVVEVLADGRRFRMERDGVTMRRGAEIV